MEVITQWRTVQFIFYM